MSAAAALRALRLNRLFPDRKALTAHAEATKEPGWPAAEHWLRVRVDQRLAPAMLTRLAALEDDDPSAKAKADYFRTLLDARLLPTERSVLRLIRREIDGLTAEWVLDRFDLSVPTFVRWTLRLQTHGEHLDIVDGRVVASSSLHRRLRVLSWRSALEFHLGLAVLPNLELLNLTRGEVGPARPGRTGPWLSAVLSRVAPHVRRVMVDDPLLERVLVPKDASGLGLSRQRKWAVPTDELTEARAWLLARSSQNLVYPYRPTIPQEGEDARAKDTSTAHPRRRR